MVVRFFISFYRFLKNYFNEFLSSYFFISSLFCFKSLFTCYRWGAYYKVWCLSFYNVILVFAFFLHIFSVVYLEFLQDILNIFDIIIQNKGLRYLVISLVIILALNACLLIFSLFLSSVNCYYTYQASAMFSFIIFSIIFFNMFINIFFLSFLNILEFSEHFLIYFFIVYFLYFGEIFDFHKFELTFYRFLKNYLVFYVFYYLSLLPLAFNFINLFIFSIIFNLMRLLLLLVIFFINLIIFFIKNLILKGFFYSIIFINFFFIKFYYFVIIIFKMQGIIMTLLPLHTWTLMYTYPMFRFSTRYFTVMEQQVLLTHFYNFIFFNILILIVLSYKIVFFCDYFLFIFNNYKFYVFCDFSVFNYIYLYLFIFFTHCIASSVVTAFLEAFSKNANMRNVLIVFSYNFFVLELFLKIYFFFEDPLFLKGFFYWYSVVSCIFIINAMYFFFIFYIATKRGMCSLEDDYLFGCAASWSHVHKFLIVHYYLILMPFWFLVNKFIFNFYYYLIKNICFYLNNVYFSNFEKYCI